MKYAEIIPPAGKFADVSSPTEDSDLEGKLPKDDTKSMLKDWGSYAVRVPMFLIPGYGYSKFLDWKAQGHKYPSKTGFTMCTALFWAAVGAEIVEYSGLI